MSVRDAFHTAVQALLEEPEEQLVRIWSDDDNGNPEYCVSVRRIQTEDHLTGYPDEQWFGVFCLMPPGEKVTWIDEKELESIVAQEKARMEEAHG